MLRAHEYFIASTLSSVDPFTLVSASSPDAVAAWGQPSPASPHGFLTVAAGGESLIEVAAALARWTSSPEWVMENAPGFILPIRCAIALRFHNDQELGIISILGRSVCTATITKGQGVPVLHIMPVVDPAYSYAVAAPVILRELIAQADESFDRFLSDSFADLTPEDLA